MSVEALLGTDRAFAEDLIALRPQPGQIDSAWNLRALLDGSEIVASHRVGDPRVQDAYSLRCAPQVIGAARDALGFASGVASVELRLGDRQPDGAARRPRRVVRELPRRARWDWPATTWPSRRPRWARSPSGGPTVCWTPADRTGCRRSWPSTPGVDSGMMLAGYTQAAMVAENRRLAAPASVDSLPTSAMQEDHVSMGWGAARKLRVVVANLTRIVAVELCCAARGLDLRAPLRARSGHGRGAVGASARGCRARDPIATWRPSWRGGGAGASGAVLRRGRGRGRAAQVSAPLDGGAVSSWSCTALCLRYFVDLDPVGSPGRSCPAGLHGRLSPRCGRRARCLRRRRAEDRGAERRALVDGDSFEREFERSTR